jgi:site-specific DNA recombinase
MLTKGSIYARVSGTDDVRVASVESQIADTRAKLTDYIITDDDIFIERYTGKFLHERPDLSRLRERIRAGYYGALGIYCLDRLSRRATHLSVLFDEAERFKCTIISATEDIENSPEGELMRNIRGYVAEVERIKIADRTNRGAQRLLDDGKLLCAGKARFGYQYVKQTRERVIVAEQAAIVQRIFKMAAQGVSIRQMCVIFNGEGIKTSREFAGHKRGTKGWVASVMRTILRDPSYYGQPMIRNKTRTVGRRENGRAQIQPIPQDQHQEIGPPTPKIVDRVLWARAQKVIDRNRTYADKVSQYKHFRMLAGMIKCRCGKSMTTQKIPRWKRVTEPISEREPYYWYVCMSKRTLGHTCDQPRRQIADVERQVWEKVTSLITDKDALQRAIDSARGNDSTLLSELESHRRLIAAAEKTASNLIDALAGHTDEIVIRPLQAKLSALTKQVAGHRQQVVEIEARLAERGQAQLGIEQVLEIFHAAMPFSWLESGPVEDLVFSVEDASRVSPEIKRAVLLALGAKITLDYRDVRVDLSVPLVSPARSRG